MKKTFILLILLFCIILTSCFTKKDMDEIKNFSINFIDLVSHEQALYGVEYTDKVKQLFWNHEDKEKSKRPEFLRITKFNDTYYAIYKNEIKSIKKIQKEKLVETKNEKKLFGDVKYSYSVVINHEQVGEIIDNKIMYFTKPKEVCKTIEVVKYKKQLYIFGYYEDNFKILEKDLPLLKERGIIE